MENFNVAGLASGFDWNSMVDQLMAIERVPQNRLRAEQSKNTEKADALSDMKTKLEKLQTNVTALKSSSLFNKKKASLSDEDLGISVLAANSAVKGSYQVEVSQLATATKRIGTSDVVTAMGDESSLISELRLAKDISAGTFSVNGQEISVSQTDTLQDVFDSISIATSGVVTASYDAINDQIVLDSASGQLELGGDEDTSNFLSAAKLFQLEVADGGGGTSTVRSRSALGVVDIADTIANSGLAGVTGAGTLHINGVAVDFDADTDSLSALISRVNASAANVTMSFDSASDQFRIVNNETGAYQMSVTDSGNGLFAALGLTGAATVGKDLQFSIDGGATKTSRANQISAADHGIDGLTINASATGTQTVTIESDTEELKSKVNSFISAFNDVQDFILEKTKIEVDDDEVTAAVLAGNRELSSLDSRLRNFAFKSVGDLEGSGLFRLEHLGIDFISGTSKLEIKDADKLDQALASELGTLETFFVGAEDNFTDRLDEFLGNYLGSDGIMETITSTYTDRNSDIDDQIEEMERRLVARREALEASFIAMEEAQSKISNQAAALAGLSL